MYKIESKPKYTILAQKTINMIYLQVQNDSRRSFSIPINSLCKILDIHNEHNVMHIIKNTLLELKKPIEFLDFYHPLRDQKYDRYIVSIIDSAGIYRRDNQWYVKINVNKLFFYFFQQKKSNFPKQLMDLDESRNL